MTKRKRPRFVLKWYYAARTNYMGAAAEDDQPMMLLADVEKLIDRVWARAVKFNQKEGRPT
jgi:hypothetical protein